MRSERTECTSRTCIWECTPAPRVFTGWGSNVRPKSPDQTGKTKSEDQTWRVWHTSKYYWFLAPSQHSAGEKKSLVLPWCFPRNHHSTSHVGKYLRTSLESSLALIPRISTAKAWPTPSYFFPSLLPPPGPGHQHLLPGWLVRPCLLVSPELPPSLHNPLSEQQADGCIFFSVNLITPSST